MAQLNTFDIKRNGLHFASKPQNVSRGCENEFRLFIDKTRDEPRACNPVDLWTLAGDPFHRRLVVGLKRSGLTGCA